MAGFFIYYSKRLTLSVFLLFLSEAIFMFLSKSAKHNRVEPSMPTALRIGPYRFYFYSYDCGEPRHMHVDRENKSAKFWLDPGVSLAENHGYSRKELRDMERFTRENLEKLRNEWDAFCGSSTP
jgi:hypothetical protein